MAANRPATRHDASGSQKSAGGKWCAPKTPPAGAGYDQLIAWLGRSQTSTSTTSNDWTTAAASLPGVPLTGS